MNGSPDQEKRSSIRVPGLGWRGGILQLIFVTVLPLTVLLLVITFGSIAVHQRAMRTMVGERDLRAVRTAAAALSAQVNQRAASIQGLARQLSPADQGSAEQVLARSGHLLQDFEGGLAVFDENGTLLASIGDPSLWASLAGGTDPNVINFFPSQTGQVFISDAFSNPGQTGSLAAISTFATPAESEGSKVVVLGTFSPGELAGSILGNAFAGDGESTVLLFDASRNLLYQSGMLPAEGEPSGHPGVAEALAGESGASFIPVKGGEHVAAYAPVVPVNWALVVEEPWEMVASPSLSYTQLAPLVLVPVLLLTLFALWFGVSRIVKPLQALEEQADALAWGDYQAVEKPVGGIAEIRRLQNGLVHMAQKVRAAQQSLHGYIGAITAGQEEERRRLARELHDDTIQSLIALKQRVQLAQMNQSNGPAGRFFSELEELTEKTIGNLRRVTRDLRPIYLEDLGLLAALEMLTREVSQAAGIEVEFQTSGTEQRLSPEVELALFRIAQEALNNVTHHAQASRASVRLAFTAEDVFLEVVDNGQGFEAPKSPAEFAPRGHYGLLGLFERAELIQAVLSIESTRGQGTRVAVILNRNASHRLAPLNTDNFPS